MSQLLTNFIEDFVKKLEEETDGTDHPFQMNVIEYNEALSEAKEDGEVTIERQLFDKAVRYYFLEEDGKITVECETEKRISEFQDFEDITVKDAVVLYKWMLAK
jgi:hypothetical protein